MTGQYIVDSLATLLSSGTKIALASDEKNGVGAARWTEWRAPTWRASVKPATVHDLQTTVRFLTKNNIPFLAVGSGHGYTASYGNAKDIVQIDINNFKDISIDKERSTMTIGGAVLHKEVIEPLWEAGKQIPFGGCSTTGIVGVTLGGGLNRWQGVWGLHADNLLEVELVTASGDLVTASKKENAELFWGMRGAGFNFGIVTSATYKVYDLLNGGNTLVVDIVLPFEKSLDVVKVLKQWEDDQDPELAIATGAMWNPEFNSPVHLVSILYHGAREKGMEYAKDFLELGPMAQNIYDCPWNEVHFKWAFEVDAFVGTYGGSKNLYSGHIKRFDLPTFEWYFAQLGKLYEEYPAARQTTLLIEDWPTKFMSEVPDDETAFPHRDVACQMILACWTEDPSLGDMLDDWGRLARDKFQETNGFGETKVYVSYAQGDETQEAIYGERKLERLRALKRKWDPQQFFSWNNPIKI